LPDLGERDGGLGQPGRDFAVPGVGSDDRGHVPVEYR
jgi:hypothetical protein